jgi:Zn-dependent protease/CBS domain-containing protein
MVGSRLLLFRVLGIPIYLDVSWLVILALSTWTLAKMFANEIPEQSPEIYWLIGGGVSLAFFACIVLHELGHAVVARRTGIPVRGITLFLFGGVAEMEREPPSAGREFLMAIGGPVVSLILAGVCLALARVGSNAGWPKPLEASLSFLGMMNLVVLVFNLVPAFPLDGGRVLRSILWGIGGNLRRATFWASLFGQAFAWFLIISGVLSFFSGQMFQGIWLGLIGLFLNNAARGSYREVLIREMLEGESVRRFMNPDPVVVPPELDLRRLVDDYVYRHHYKLFPVASNGHLEGVIRTKSLSQYPREEWDRHTIGEAMNHDWTKLSISPDADALKALAKMKQTGCSRLLVTEGDHLVGIVSLKDLLHFLDRKMALESELSG